VTAPRIARIPEDLGGKQHEQRQRVWSKFFHVGAARHGGLLRTARRPARLPLADAGRAQELLESGQIIGKLLLKP
jgi:hypothetical protein